MKGQFCPLNMCVSYGKKKSLNTGGNKKGRKGHNSCVIITYMGLDWCRWLTPVIVALQSIFSTIFFFFTEKALIIYLVQFCDDDSMMYQPCDRTLLKKSD